MRCVSSSLGSQSHVEAAAPTRQRLHRRGVRLEVFTVVYNVAEAAIAIAAGLAANSVALIGFGVDSGIEVTAASALLWRLRRAGPDASQGERGAAERRALYIVGATFVTLGAYILWESIGSLLAAERPDESTAGLIIAAVSLAVMPALAYAKQKTGKQLDSRALVADAAETWVCSYLSLALLAGVGLHALLGWWWADPLAALLMLPVIAWQAYETVEEAREMAEN
jgi:cation diffusion facilitator family transporter